VKNLRQVALTFKGAEAFCAFERPIERPQNPRNHAVNPRVFRASVTPAA